MSDFATKNFTFEGLRCPLGSDKDPGSHSKSLGYIVGVTDSPSHPISAPLTAKRILCWLAEIEGQASNTEHLRAGEEFFKRYFDGGYQPRTPCMVVTRWSPIAAMLESGFEPLVLNRENTILAVATGIWEPCVKLEPTEIHAANTDRELFWAIIGTVSRRAAEQESWISIIAKPGWNYDSAIGSLPDWPPEDVARSGRVLWKRTPEG
jgi:hypothetical protein